MRPYFLTSVTVALALLVATTLDAGEEGRSARPALGLPGSGAMIGPEGGLERTGASQINIPLAYTLHRQQRHRGLYWSQQGEPHDIPGLLSFSLGQGQPGQGLSLTALLMEGKGLSGAVQKQLWPETSKWPAIAAGFYDLADRMDRGGYVVATQRIGGRLRSHQLVVGWPPDEGRAVCADDKIHTKDMVVAQVA